MLGGYNQRIGRSSVFVWGDTQYISRLTTLTEEINVVLQLPITGLCVQTVLKTHFRRFTCRIAGKPLQGCRKVFDMCQIAESLPVLSSMIS